MNDFSALALYDASGTTPVNTFEVGTITPGQARSFTWVIKAGDPANLPPTFAFRVLEAGSQAADWITGTVEHQDVNGATLETTTVAYGALALVHNMVAGEQLVIALTVTVPGTVPGSSVVLVFTPEVLEVI